MAIENRIHLGIVNIDGQRYQMILRTYQPLLPDQSPQRIADATAIAQLSLDMHAARFKQTNPGQEHLTPHQWNAQGVQFTQGFCDSNFAPQDIEDPNAINPHLTQRVTQIRQTLTGQAELPDDKLWTLFTRTLYTDQPRPLNPEALPVPERAAAVNPPPPHAEVVPDAAPVMQQEPPAHPEINAPPQDVVPDIGEAERERPRKQANIRRLQNFVEIAEGNVSKDTLAPSEREIYERLEKRYIDNHEEKYFCTPTFAYSLRVMILSLRQ